MVYRSKKRKKKLRQRFLKKILYKFLLPFLIIFILFVFLWNADFLKISQVKIEGIKNVPVAEIEKSFGDIVSGSYFYLFDKNNFLFYPEEGAKKEILKKFRRIKDIKISYDDFFSGNLKIEVKERVPKFLFCQKNDNCFFMEEDGFIFSKLSPEELKNKKNFLVFSIYNSDKLPNIFLEEKDFTRIRTLILDLNNLNLKIIKVVALENNEFLLKTKSGASLLISLSGDFSKIPNILKKISLKEDLKIDSNKKDFKNKVKYINLTFKNTIYYCMVGDVCQSNYP